MEKKEIKKLIKKYEGEFYIIEKRLEEEDLTEEEEEKLSSEMCHLEHLIFELEDEL